MKERTWLKVAVGFVAIAFATWIIERLLNWVFPESWFTTKFTALYSFLGAVVLPIGKHLFGTFPIPRLVVYIVLFFIIRAVVKVFKDDRPQSDIVNGVLWRWGYVGNQITNPAPFCPECDLQLLLYESGRYSAARCDYTLSCPRCGTDFLEYPTAPVLVRDTKLEIERRLRVAVREKEKEKHNPESPSLKAG